MSRIDFSIKSDPDTTARALGYELHISPKHAREICRTLRKKRVAEAKKILEDVIERKRAIEFRRFKKKVAHRPDGGPGRYPVKAAGEILKIIKDVEGNARYKGLDPDGMRIIHIATKKGRPIKGMIPRAYGRATPKDVETVSVEVIIGE
jgi:large subunit ribosomal protein L22